MQTNRVSVRRTIFSILADQHGGAAAGICILYEQKTNKHI